MLVSLFMAYQVFGGIMFRIAVAATLLLATAPLAVAQSLDDQIHDFIHAPGFAAEDISRLDERLINQWLDLTGATPGGSVGPLEKAMLIADMAIEGIRTRSALSYGEIVEADGTPYSFIEVRHYNLAAVIHAETADAYGIENTAPVEDFGRGEHMQWRFVFMPEMNNAAILLEASSRIISDKQAAKSDCTGRPCLDPYAGFDAFSWEEIDGQVPVWPELYVTESDEVATPAHAIAQLAVFGFWANAESGDYQWTGGEHPEAARDATPYRFIGIDRHLGQEATIDAIWQETALNDDELSAIAFRRAEIGGAVQLMRATETR
jgi:hypothetical protein